MSIPSSSKKPRDLPPLSLVINDSQGEALTSDDTDEECITCKNCHVPVGTGNSVLSRAFRGHSGKAVLLTEAMNISLENPSVLLMDSGAHTIQQFTCAHCETYLGWKVARAHEPSEKWKEGKFILELDFINDIPEGARRPPYPPQPPPQQIRSAIVRPAESLGHRRSHTDSNVQLDLGRLSGENRRT